MWLIAALVALLCPTVVSVGRKLNTSHTLHAAAPPSSGALGNKLQIKKSKAGDNRGKPSGVLDVL